MRTQIRTNVRSVKLSVSFFYFCTCKETRVLPAAGSIARPTYLGDVEDAVQTRRLGGLVGGPGVPWRDDDGCFDGLCSWQAWTNSLHALFSWQLCRFEG